MNIVDPMLVCVAQFKLLGCKIQDSYIQMLCAYSPSSRWVGCS